MSSTALVTGATGLIGRYVAEQLLREGRTVRALVRNVDLLGADLRRSLDISVGDLRDERVLTGAMEGVKEVYHLAACARVWSRDPHEYQDVNVRAVRTLLGLAAEHEVERFVHVSTILTLPPHTPAPLGERARRLTPYEVTKKEGEQLVEEYAALGRHAVIVHPTRVYGPGPLNDANSVTRTVALYMKGRFRVRLADGDVLGNYVHAADVSAGILLAAERGRSGAHYLLGGEDIAFRDLLALVADLSRVQRWVLPLPARVGMLMGSASVLWARMGGRALLTPEWVRTFLEDRRADIGPAREELGYSPRSLREGLTQTIAWLRREGYVR